MDVGPERPRHLRPEPRSERRAGHPAHDLAHQVAEGVHVVAVRGVGDPPWRLPFERLHHHVPVEHGTIGQRIADGRETGAMGKDLADRDALLAGATEPGPVADDLGIQVEKTAFDELEDADRTEPLPHREEVDQRVPTPGATTGRVRPAAPQVDDDPPADRDGDRRTDVAPVGEVPHEGVADRGESRVADAVDGEWFTVRDGHATRPSTREVPAPRSPRPR